MLYFFGGAMKLYLVVPSTVHPGSGKNFQFRKHGPCDSPQSISCYYLPRIHVGVISFTFPCGHAANTSFAMP